MASRMLNIAASQDDVYYPYKMSPIKTKLEERGNRMKTLITNIDDIAAQLHTQPCYVTKYFGYEINTGSLYDDKRHVALISGVHKPEELQQLLTKFIIQFILCRKCKLPELKCIVYTGSNFFYQVCSLCGWKGYN